MLDAKMMLDAITHRDMEEIRRILSSGQLDECDWYRLVVDALGCFNADLNIPPHPSMKLPTTEEPIVRLPEQNSLSIIHMMAEHCSTRSHGIQTEFKRALADNSVRMAHKPIYERLMEVLTNPPGES